MTKLVDIMKHAIFLALFRIIKNFPKNIVSNIRKLIINHKLFKILFGLPYGVLLVHSPKNKIGRIIFLNKKITPSSIFVLDINAIDIYNEIFQQNVYEKYQRIRKGDLVIDIGANIGLFAIKAANIMSNKGHVIAIEPEPINIKLLENNCINFSNISIISKAVGNQEGEIKLILSELAGTHKIALNDIDQTNQKNIMVSITTLDNIVTNLNLKKIDFVKIDVEGLELEVLKGAPQALKIIKFLSIASYHSPEERLMIKEYLENNNFRVISEEQYTYAWNNNIKFA